ncbi:MAG: two-component system sensor histidine kinase BaeS [Chitinophagales bacterium]|jgi:two-component system sensor histidine kinase BaeS
MNSIQLKLICAFLLTTFIATAGMFAFMQWSFDRGFLSYVNSQELAKLTPLSDELGELYGKQGSWVFIQNDRRVWRGLHREYIFNEDLRFESTDYRSQSRPPPALRKTAQSEGRELLQRISLLDAKRDKIIGRPFLDKTSSNSDHLPITQEITSDGVIVGYLQLAPSKSLQNQLDLGFAASQTKTFALISAAMLALSLLISIPLARQLVRPILKLLSSTKSLSAGNYNVDTKSSSKDELGQLSNNFNQLAKILRANESSRKQWVSDISHELRTPIAVLKGQIEAMIDGIRPSDKGSLRQLNNNINQLGKLVNDLYQLSLSDQGSLNYRKENVKFAPVVTQTINNFDTEFQHRGISIKLVNSARANDTVFADKSRLQQLLANLLTNTLRYTDSPGELKIRLSATTDTIQLELNDSSPGVSDTDLQQLFDRLFRAEKSRNRAGGGAGLGLSLCKNIVQAHDGSITAAQSNLGGLRIVIKLPLVN